MFELILSPNTSPIFLTMQILVIISALFLVALAVKAWKNTRLNKMIYLIIAFALFAVPHILNYIDQAVVHIVSDDVRYVVTAISQLVIMAMFVLAVLKK